ncbi:MAG: hypothetical protein RIR62_2481 [Pseudomonadota bacterium]|jgi:hypothetical protein
MRHDWILDVLADLRGYAERNALPATARAAADALALVRAELADQQAAKADAADQRADMHG